jgi:hypothetical protein
MFFIGIDNDFEMRHIIYYNLFAEHTGTLENTNEIYVKFELGTYRLFSRIFQFLYRIRTLKPSRFSKITSFNEPCTIFSGI